MDKKSNDDLKMHDPAKNSGLFAKSKPPTVEKKDQAKPNARKNRRRKPLNSSDSQATASDDAQHHRNHDESNAQAEVYPWAEAQSLFEEVAGAVGHRSKDQNAALFAICRKVSKAFKGLIKEAAELRIKARARDNDAKPLDRAEMEAIITEAIRSNKETGTNVKGLADTIERLRPDLFTDATDTRPSPDAVVRYITTFAGRPGSEIVLEQGGADFLADNIGAILNCSVSIRPISSD